ncbi:hypothetical protein SAMN05444126_1251, partial [Salisediminibacterium halotolerans]
MGFSEYSAAFFNFGSKIFVGVLTQKNTRKLLYPLDLNYQETKPK